MKRFSWLFLSVFAVLAGNLSAQTPAPAAPGPSGALPAGLPGPRVKFINHRLMEQAARIRDGKLRKLLTDDTAKPLWEQAKTIRDQEKSDMIQNGKRELTDDQFASLNQALDQNSKAIYAAKHPGSAAPAAAAPAPAAPSSAVTAPDSDTDASN